MPILKEKIKLSNDKIYDFDNISLFSNIMTIVFDKNVDIWRHWIRS